MNDQQSRFIYKPEFFLWASFKDSSSIGFCGPPGGGLLIIGLLGPVGLGPCDIFGLVLGFPN